MKPSKRVEELIDAGGMKYADGSAGAGAFVVAILDYLDEEWEKTNPPDKSKN